MFRMDALQAMEITDLLPRDASPELKETLKHWLSPQDPLATPTFIQGALSGMLIAQYLATKGSDDNITPTKEGLSDLWDAITEVSHLYLSKVDAAANNGGVSKKT